MVQFKTIIPEGLRDEVQAYAQRHDLNLSQLNRWALQKFMKEAPTVPEIVP